MKKIEILFIVILLLITCWLSNAWTKVHKDTHVIEAFYSEKNKERFWIKILPDSLLSYIKSMPDFEEKRKNFTIQLHDQFFKVTDKNSQDHRFFNDFFYHGALQNTYDSLCLNNSISIIQEENGKFETLSKSGEYGFVATRCDDGYIYLPVSIIASIVKTISSKNNQNSTLNYD
jgi:hypothetical protein